MFSPWFLEVAVYGGLVFVAAAAISLSGLWIADLRAGRLW